MREILQNEDGLPDRPAWMRTRMASGKSAVNREEAEKGISMESERKSFLDLARVTAMMMVILVHTCSGVRDVMPDQMTAMQIRVYDFLKGIGASGVPVFVMISGSLFLEKKRRISVKQLLCRYIRRLVLALALFGTLFAFMEIVMVSRTVTLAGLGQAFVNMLTGRSWAHLWYLYVFIGLYLILPLLKAFADQADRNTYRYILIVLLLFNSVLPAVRAYTGFDFGVYIPISLIYVFYFLLGHYLEAYCTGSEKLKRMAAAGLTVCFLLLAAGMLSGWNLITGYDSPLTVGMSVSIFYLIAACAKGEYRFCGRCRKYIFGVYLMHTVFLNLCYKVLHLTPLMAGGYVLIPVFMILTFVITLAVVRVLYRIPFLGKYVL